MPRIPESAVTVGLPSVSSQPIREVLEIGDAVAGLTEASAELASRLAQAQRADELTQKSSTMEGSLADLQLAIQQDPELNTVASAGQAYKEGATAIFEEHGQSDSQVVSRALEKRFLQSSLRGTVAVKRVAFGRQADASIAGLDAAAEDYSRNYAVAQDDEERERIRAVYAQDVDLNAFIGEQAKGDRIQAFNASVDETRIETLLNDDRADLALSLLRDEDALPGLDAAMRERLEERTLGKLRGDAEAELDIRISRGLSTEAEIREFRELNIITSSAMATKIQALDRVNAVQNASQVGLLRTASALTGVGFPLDPESGPDKKGLDLFYRAVILPQLEGLQGSQRSDAITRLVVHPGIGMLPKSLQSEIRGKLRSGSVAEVVEASDLIDRIRSFTPRALDDLSAKNIGFAFNVSAQVRAGVDSGKAVSHAKEVEKIPESEQIVLRDRFGSQENRLIIEERLADISDRPFIFTGSRGVPPQFEGELTELAEIAFMLNGGEMDVALDVAQQQMSRVWAETQVDGGPTRMMKYAPEAVYQQFPDSDSMREQLLRDVNENAIPEVPIEQIRLVADLETGRRMPPDYVVEILQDTGEWLPTIINGKTRRFRFDFASSPEGQRQAEEAAEVLESAKSRRIELESGVVWSQFRTVSRGVPEAGP